MHDIDLTHTFTGPTGFTARVQLLLSVFTTLGNRRQRPNLADLARAMGESRLNLSLIRLGRRPPRRETVRMIVARAAALLDLPEEDLRRFIEAGSPDVKRQLIALLGRRSEARCVDSAAERLRRVLSPFLGSRRERGALERLTVPALSARAGLPPHRVYAACRGRIVLPEKEVEQLARAGAALLQLPEETVLAYLRTGDPAAEVLISERSSERTACILCGKLGTPQDPLSVTHGMHASCMEVLLAPAHLSWTLRVDQIIDGAPEALRRAWAELRRSGEPINFYRLAGLAGMERRRFRRMWLMSGLPPEPTPRQRARSSLGSSLFQERVEARIADAPANLRDAYLAARARGGRLTLERIAEAAGLSYGALRRKWSAAGLPCPHDHSLSR